MTTLLSLNAEENASYTFYDRMNCGDDTEDKQLAAEFKTLLGIVRHCCFASLS